ncbi:hypothetical protein ACJMK2_004870 [Sinanodonta woodiana]|uniref:Uncharacterized protein n=1 Tax=Sinanodonta woodiana TaxID=1069815 RepID=A0ABD3VNF6_SINWO
MSLVASTNHSSSVQAYESTQIKLVDTSVHANVPEDPRGKLMYYLKCMCSVINLTDVHPEVQRLTDYHRYDIGRNDIDTLIKMCQVLAPDKLENKCIFECPALCGSWSARFYEVNEIRQQVLSTTATTSITALAGKSALFASATATATVILEGTCYSIMHILTYTNYWMEEYFRKPMKLLQRNSSICTLL